MMKNDKNTFQLYVRIWRKKLQKRIAMNSLDFTRLICVLQIVTCLDGNKHIAKTQIMHEHHNPQRSNEQQC